MTWMHDMFCVAEEMTKIKQKLIEVEAHGLVIGDLLRISLHFLI